jgi:enoyl-CoA hydratase
LTQVDVTVEGSVASIVINRPEVMNSVSPSVLADLHAAIDEVESARARVCILSGAGGRAFSAGADLTEMLKFTLEDARSLLDSGVALTRRLETGSFVSIAAIHGYALGGGTEIALACDLRFANDTAKLGLPEVTVGIFPGWGGVVRLPRQAPQPIALDMILSGRIIGADEALAAGLIDGIVDDPLEAARQAAERLIRAGPTAQMLARRIIRETARLDLDVALAHASEAWMSLMDSGQRIEGHRAFIEKRAADWSVAER